MVAARLRGSGAGSGNNTYAIIGALSLVCSRRRPQAHPPTWKSRLLFEIGETTLAIADLEAQSRAVVERVEILLDAIKGANARRQASLSSAGRDYHRRVAEAAAKEADALLGVRWDHPSFPRANRPLPPTIGEIRRGLERYRKITGARVDVLRAEIGINESFLRHNGAWRDAPMSAHSVAEQRLAALERGGE